MSDSRHIQLNSRWYSLAESAEGDHYHIRREPLRVPNSQVVQGAEKFQLRPDLIQWNITDWSEGEGQIKYDQQQPGRSYLLMNVDPFAQPGNLILGPPMEAMQYSGADYTEGVLLSRGPGSYVWAVEHTPSPTYIDIKRAALTSNTFSASFTSTIAGGVTAVVGDDSFLYLHAPSTEEIWTFDGTTFAVLNDQVTGTNYVHLAEMGNYLYIYDIDNGIVYEILKDTANTATPEVALYDFSATGGTSATNIKGNYWIIAGDNRLYVLQYQANDTIIHEIVPTTAAYTGYGRELARMPGTKALDLAWFGGFILFLGESINHAGETRREAFYLQPGQSLGTLGEVRSHLGDGPDTETRLSSFIAGQSNLRYVTFLGPDYDDEDAWPALFIIDTVSGGFGQLTAANAVLDASGADSVQSIIETEGAWYLASAGSSFVYRTQPGEYISAGYAISPYNDFQIADEKLLRDITVTCEPLPADTSIGVYYDLGDGVWTSAGTISTTDSEGETFTVSTDTSSKTFRHLRVKLEMGTESSTVTPTIRSAEVRASVVKYLNVWELLVDLTDDHPQYGRSGGNDAAALLALAENTVYKFLDGYQAHPDGTAAEYDVELDAVNIILSQPGEGYAQVVLRET